VVIELTFKPEELLLRVVPSNSKDSCVPVRVNPSPSTEVDSYLFVVPSEEFMFQPMQYFEKMAKLFKKH
jgi:hypothetical protein